MVGAWVATYLTAGFGGGGGGGGGSGEREGERRSSSRLVFCDDVGGSRDSRGRDVHHPDTYYPSVVDLALSARNAAVRVQSVFVKPKENRRTETKEEQEARACTDRTCVRKLFACVLGPMLDALRTKSDSDSVDVFKGFVIGDGDRRSLTDRSVHELVDVSVDGFVIFGCACVRVYDRNHFV